MIRTTLALLAAGAAMLPAPTLAAVSVFTADLSGLNEVPPNASPGTGFATVTLDDVANTMRVQVNFSGLTGTTTAAHIHCCAPLGTNASVATTTPSFVGFPLGVTAGTMDQTYDMTQASSYRAGFITDHGGTVASARAALFAGIAGGQSYLNIHTSIFPGGEIRAQLLRVPEPATWGLMIAGFGLAGAALRSKRRPALA